MIPRIIRDSYAIHHYENTWFGMRNRLANIFLRHSQLIKAHRKGRSAN